MSERFDFEGVEPSDGYQVELTSPSDGLFRIYVGLFSANKPVLTSSVKVCEFQVESHNYGQVSRSYLLTQAICHFLTAGGSLSELFDIYCKLKANSFNGLEYPGWSYLDGYTDTDGGHTHVWVANNSEQVVRWVVDQYVDTGLTLTDLQEEEREALLDESVHCRPEVAAIESIEITAETSGEVKE